MESEFTNIKSAMEWWDGLSSLRKTQICDTNIEYLKGIRRWETLTRREIEYLFNICKDYK